jgi:hypothetical protein
MEHILIRSRTTRIVGIDIRVSRTARHILRLQMEETASGYGEEQ